MSFLLIVPTGWVELPDAQAFVDLHTEAQLLDLISQGAIAAIEAMIQDGGYVPADQPVVDVRLFRDEGAYRLWYRLG